MASTCQRPNGESEQRFIPEALNAPQRLLPKAADLGSGELLGLLKFVMFIKSNIFQDF